MKNIKKLFGDRFYNAVFLSVVSILALWSCAASVADVFHSHWLNLTDNLYNYAGGFIRRGLSGEILFFIKDATGMPPLVTSYVASVTAYLIVAWFAISRFRKHGYALNVLIMGFMLGGILITSVEFMRRDYIEMAIFIGIIAAYRRLPTAKWILLGNVCAVIAILLHEASFFFMVPVCVFITNIRLKSMVKSVCLWLPALAAFLLCCRCKGTPEMLPAICGPIWEYAPEVLENGQIPGLLSFIGKDMGSVLLSHISYNFTSPVSEYLPVPAVFLTLFYFIYIPYITVCMIKVFSRNGLSGSRQKSLTALIIFQFVMLLPMFALLSCDISRVAMYWMMSSTVVWLVLDDREIESMFPLRFGSFSERVSAFCFNRRLPGKAALTLCMLFIGVVSYRRTLMGILASAPIGKFALIARTVIESVFHTHISLL